MVGRHAGVGERDDRERGVPHRRLARLEPAAAPVVDGEPVEALESGAMTG